MTDLGMAVFTYLQSESQVDATECPGVSASDVGGPVCAQWKPASPGHRRQLVMILLAVITLGSVGFLFVQDAVPERFPARAHELLATLPLALAALSLLANHAVRQAVRRELPKTLVLVAGFLFWSANQLWPHSSQAPIFNDIAIALFALDVVLVILGRAPDPGEEKSA